MASRTIMATYLDNLEQARSAASNHVYEGSEVALVTGCYDCIHVGHIAVIERANDLGVVFVGINTDESIRELKGPKRPINPLQHRIKILLALRYVSYVFPISDTTVTKTIRTVSPNFWLKGGDYTLETLNQEEVKAAKEVGASIVLVPIVEGVSTTAMLAKL